MSGSNVELMTEQRALVVGGPDGQVVWLTVAEHRVYQQLLQADGELVTHTALQKAVYQDGEPAVSNCVQVFVSRLRKKLTAAGANQRIKIARAVGYKLITVAL